MVEKPDGASLTNSIDYKHWNIFFKDIYRVSIDIVDRETNKIISQSDLERLLHGGGEAAQGSRNAANGARGGSSVEGQDRQIKIYFILKIFYQLNEAESEEAEGTITGSHVTLVRSKARGNSRDIAGGDGLLGRLSGLKVGRKQIISRDWKVMRRVYTAI